MNLFIHLQIYLFIYNIEWYYFILDVNRILPQDFFNFLINVDTNYETNEKKEEKKMNKKSCGSLKIQRVTGNMQMRRRRIK